MLPPYKCNDSYAYPAYENDTSYLNDTSFNNSQEHHQQQIGVHDWISAGLNAIVFILATLGNSLVITTLLSKKMSSVTNYFLFSLAVSDLMVALICIPLTTVGKLLADFIFGELACKILGYLMNVSVAVSTFTMAAISLERYFAICRPFQARSWQTKSHALKVIIVIWLFSALLMSPLLFIQRVKPVAIARYQICTRQCRSVFARENADDVSLAPPIAKKAWYSLQFIILLVIPGIGMIVAYGRVCRTISNGFNFQSRQGTETPDCYTPRSDRKGVIGNQANGCGCNVKDPSKNNCPSPPEGNGAKSLLTVPVDIQPQSPGHSRKTENRKQLQEKKNVVEMLIIIVIFFFVCWTPNMVANLWKSFDPYNAQRILRGVPINIIQILVYISCCINPIVYCFLNKRFRRAFFRTLSKCCPCVLRKYKYKSYASRQPATQYTAVTTT